MWDPTHRSKRRRRAALRRQLVHAAGCCELDTSLGIRCWVAERFNYDESWPELARELGVRIPRSMRRIAKWFNDHRTDKSDSRSGWGAAA